ncbi:unnamed protein product [Acanthocheilonema viteae]|uniref:CBM21 domain-containing protein n=1 Tax=Acanthocheilonema viteae TaxID=6277 RepID=A0A498S449_ACAVI|nr:unnamed protein product [Acanthocheilonema viteae]
MEKSKIRWYDMEKVKSFEKKWQQRILAVVVVMLANNSGGDRVLSKTSSRSSMSIRNNSKSTKGILRCKSEHASPTQRQRIKKNVRFSDCIDLEQAEYAINTQAERYNAEYTDRAITDGSYSSALELQLQKYFWLPIESELRWLVGEKCVHLESVRWFGRAITGMVRVKNLDYEKKVEILYTFNDWTTLHTVKGTYTE